MPLPPHRSLSSRLSLMVGLSSAAMTLVALSVVVAVLIQLANVRMKDHAEQHIAFLTESLELPLWSLDLDAVQAIGKALAQDEMVGLVEITGARGELIFRRDKGGVLLLERRAEVSHNGQVIGTARLGLNDSLRRSATWAVLLTGAGLAALIIALQLLLHRYLFKSQLRRHFADLDRMIGAYTAGDFSAAPPPSPPAEFESLYRLLSDMGATIRRQMEDLRASRERLSMALEGANDGLWDWNVTTGKAFFSPRFYTMLGYEPDEFEGSYDAWSELLHPDDRGRVLAVLSERMAESRPYETEFRMRDKAGQWSWVLARGRVVEWDDQGRAARMVGTHVDINERKRAEEALRRSEERYRNIAEHSPMGLHVCELRGDDLVIVDMNPAAERLLGTRREDILGRVLDEAFPALKGTEYPARYREIAAGGEPWSFEYARREDGDFAVAIAATAFQISPGRMALFFMDIRERMRAEIQLRRSEEKFSTLYRLSPDNIMLIDLEDMTIADVNETFVRTSGYSRQEVLGRTTLELDLYVDLAQMEAIRTLIKANGRVDNFEAEFRGKHGSTGTYSVSGRVVTIDGRPFLLTMSRNITETKKMQEVMVQTEKMISVGGIAAGIAHEINNPLGIVLQAAQNLVQRTRPDFPKNIEAARDIGLDMDLLRKYMRARKLDSFIEDIRAAAVRAAGIIRHLLDFSRRSESRRVACDLPGIVNKAIALARSDYDLKKKYDFKRCRVDIEMDDDLPVVRCTETEIEQVLLNLLRNAAQAMAEAEPPVAEPCILVRIARRRTGLRIEVEDNGPGIPAEIRRRVFEPFFTTKAPGVGTGLGLSVSYFIVTKGHGGQMRVEPRPDGGTRFVIDLPVEEARA